jgi:hypothetical protein
MFRVALTLTGDVCSGAFDIEKIVRCQVNRVRAETLFQAFQFSSAGNGNDPGFLSRQLGQGNPGSGRTLPLRDAAEQIDQDPVGLSRLRTACRADPLEQDLDVSVRSIHADALAIPD